jgi:GNAT superfamily N-acetyltransferase
MSERITKALIRRATPEDAAAIGRVEVDAWQAGYLGLVPAAVLNNLSAAGHAARWRRVLNSGPVTGALAWVLVVGDAVVGFTSAGPTRDEDDDPGAVGEVYTLYLLPSAWGRGLGAALLEAAQNELARRCYRTATLWVLEGNTRGRRFYELSGMAWDGARRPVRVGHITLPELRYRRSL